MHHPPAPPPPHYLFGGSTPWSPALWSPLNDTLRGGSSSSHLTSTSQNRAIFSGNLDIKTLGGAGFASQMSTARGKDGKEGLWDLSAYDGISIEIGRGGGDGKVYTFILKDKVPLGEGREGGEREKAGVNWEVEFRALASTATATEKERKEGGQVVYCPWADFKPTYRGREKKDAGCLKTGEIRRVSFMMRSFFGTQEGKFKVELVSLSAVKRKSEEGSEKGSFVGGQGDQAEATEDIDVEKRADVNSTSWFSWLPSHCVVS